MLSDDEIAAIERRAAAAAPGPWVAWMESRHGIGGESFIQLRPDAPEDDEIYVRRFIAGQEVKGPSAVLDADIDFIAAARQDIPRLIDEVKRLKAELGEKGSSHSLPTKEQLQAVRNFLHGRAYSAAAAAIQLPGESPHAEDSPMADVPRVTQALYEVVNVLARRVNDAIYAGQAGVGALAAWSELLILLRPWQNLPQLPETIKQLVDTAFPPIAPQSTKPVADS